MHRSVIITIAIKRAAAAARNGGFSKKVRVWEKIIQLFLNSLTVVFGNDKHVNVIQNGCHDITKLLSNYSVSFSYALDHR